MWLILSATLVVLLYILIARDLPVPDFILRRVEARLGEANFTIKFGRAHLNPTGQILLEDVQLMSKNFNEPLLKSRLVYFRRSFWSIIAGRPIPDEIKLEGATLQLPAILSPSGVAESLIHDLAVIVRHEDNFWHIDQLTGRIGPLKVTVQGDFTPPPLSQGTKPSSPQDITAQFLQLSRRLVLEIDHLKAFEEPSLSVHLETQSGIGNTASCVFTANAAHRPWAQPFTLGNLAITTDLRLDGNSERIVRLHVTTRSVSQPDIFALDKVDAVFSARVAPVNFVIRPTEALVTIGSVAADNERVMAPVMRADLNDWPNLKASTVLQIGGEFLIADIEANLAKQSARIVAEGSGSPEIINRVLAKHTPRAAPYFIFSDPVIVSAEAILSPGWHFEKLISRVAAGRINSHDVKITSARGRIDIVGMSFLAYEAQVEMGESVARGSYWMDFASTDYRMLLKGKILPPKISGWFNGTWWTDFWNDHFSFPNALPEGDVDVQGRWKDVSRTEYFGRAEANTASVWGGEFDQAQAVVFLRPVYTDVIQFSGTRASGAQHLSGSLKRLANLNGKEMSQIQFNLDGNIDPETYHGMLEGKADEVMATLRFSTPPHVHAQGSITAQGATTTPNYTFTGHAEGGVRYYGFPLETIRVNGDVSGTEIHLNEIQFRALGGQGAGKATLSGQEAARQLGFDLYLNGAELAQTVLAVQEFQMTRNGQKPTYAADSDLIKRLSGGHLDIALSAQGSPDTIASFSGTGNAALTGADLGEIHLFGLLSQVLSGLSLNFSSLKLDSAHTSFRVENGRLHFPDLKITGPSAVIDARGDFILESNALDFTAKFKPFEESRTLLTAAIGIVINPITSILELKLVGPLNKPTWAVAIGSTPVRPQPITAKEINPNSNSAPLK